MRRVFAFALAIPFLAVLPGCVAPQNAPAVSVFDDENIEADALERINNGHNGKVHVTATSFNRRLLLTGEVPSETSKAEIDKLVSGVPRVRAVSNELVVGEISGVSSRTADSWITSDVKRRLRGSPAFSSGQIKVVAEGGTVFLMGNVSRKQGAAAAEIASTTNRVARVILIFDYVD
jgi:osmotically-inducible protein OsmY